MSSRPPRNKRRGSALIELTMILPLLFAIGYGGTEIARTFQSYEALSSISREGARIGILDCAPSTTPTACLNTVLGKTQAYADQAMPGTSIVLSMYEYDPGPKTVSRVAMVFTSGAPPTRYDVVSGPGIKTNVRIETISTPGEQDTLTDYRTRMVVSEVFFTQGSVSPQHFIPYFSPSTVYETTIF